MKTKGKKNEVRIGGSALNAGLCANDVSQGYYFRFERGMWEKRGDAYATHHATSGTGYVGWLTKEQRDSLDALIDSFIRNIEDENRNEEAHNIPIKGSAPALPS